MWKKTIFLKITAMFSKLYDVFKNTFYRPFGIQMTCQFNAKTYMSTQAQVQYFLEGELQQWVLSSDEWNMWRFNHLRLKLLSCQSAVCLHLEAVNELPLSSALCIVDNENPL